MHRLENKKKVYLYILLLIFLTSVFNKNLQSKFFNLFLIKKINISGIDQYEKKIIRNKLNEYYDINILSLNRQLLTKHLGNLTFIEQINIKKIFPSQIDVIAQRTKLLAIVYLEGKKFYIGNNKKLINSKDIKNINENKLPIVFGNAPTDEFIKLLYILKNKKIETSLIKNFHYFQSKRWDLSFYDGNLLRLPSKNLEKAIENFIAFKKQNDLINNTTIDLRISDRIILSNE